MGFNFKAAQAQAAADLKNDKLGLLVLGASGAGKSSVIGTLGVKTLYLYTTGESHGVSAAATQGGENVVPVCLDYADGKGLTADAAYDRLMAVLSDVEGIKKEGFGAIALDGASELEVLIRGTSRWRVMCQTDKGNHNSWEEGKATLAMFRPIIAALKDLQRSIGIHYVVTCILDVNSIGDDGEIMESKPKLQTYSVAEGVLQQFPDIVALGRMSKGDEIAHRIQFLAGVSRSTKDASGNIIKTVNFHPRLTGRVLADLPNTAKADLSELVKLKVGK